MRAKWVQRRDNALERTYQNESGVAMEAKRLKNEYINTTDYFIVTLKRPFSAAC